MIKVCQYHECKRPAQFNMGWRNENGKLHWGYVCATHDRELGRTNLSKFMSLEEAILFEKYAKLTVNLVVYPDFPVWLRKRKT